MSTERDDFPPSIPFVQTAHYRCLCCGETRDREDVEGLPAGDEYCSHEWELVDPIQPLVDEQEGE